MTAWIIAAALLSAPPTPKAFLGYEVGTRPASPATVVAYMSALAEASPRVRMVKMGETHEGRDLVLLLIGSEAHLASAEQLSETFRRVSDPRKVSSDDEARRALKGLPAVAWMSYTIHGNETSGSDSAMEVAYRLATSDDPITRAIRDQVLVYLDPLQNPDGRQRAVSAHESTTTKVVDLDTVSLHSSEMWPYGRGNHYLFDLNRDWFSLVHPESRARVSRIAQALPQLQVDAHEMGPNETFLFTPSRHPFNPQRPSTLSRWEGRFSRDLARAFDANGWSYYTREWNEEFFPGYGSSWSAYLGTIGILYEQARTQGFTLKQRGGTILTYKEAVAHQTTSSIANLQTLAENRAAVLEDWLRARRSAARASSRTLFKAYVFRGDRHPERARRLAEVLTLQGIEVLRASKPVTLNGAHDIFGTVQKLTVPAGSYLVRLDQPNARLIRNLFDFHVPMGAKFLREQREYLELGKGSRLYETTAWSLPHAYGLDTYWTSSIPSGAWEATPASPLEGNVLGAAKFGFMWDGTYDRSVYLAARLLARGVRVHVAKEPTTIGATAYPRGSFLVKIAGNPADTRATLQTLSQELRVRVQGVSTNLATRGTDLGGDNLLPLIEPRVAILAGDPIRPDAYGFVWHLLDQRVGIRLSRLNIASIATTDLQRYDVLVLPRAYALGAYRARLGDAVMEKLSEWTHAGGTLIGIGEGAELIAHPDAELTTSRFRRHVLQNFPPVVFGLDPNVVDRAGRQQAVGLRASPESDEERPSAGWSDLARPYSVYPVFGPGSLPFVTSGPPPFEFPEQRQTLDAWIEPVAPGGEEEREAYLERADARLRRFSPSGVYLNATLDGDHWLTYGAPERLPVYFAGGDALIAEAPAEVAIRLEDAEEMHLGGLLWPEAAGRLAKTAYAVRESVGRGQVVLFASDPAFRGTAFATQRLLTNAIVLGPGLGSAWSSPW